MNKNLEFILEIIDNNDCNLPPLVDKLTIIDGKIYAQHQKEDQQYRISPNEAIDLVLSLKNVNEYHNDSEVIYFLKACQYLKDLKITGN